jgi:hypothetical protein
MRVVFLLKVKGEPPGTELLAGRSGNTPKG